MHPDANSPAERKGKGLTMAVSPLNLLVPSARIERAAYGLGGRCSILLSYEGAVVGWRQT